MSFDPSLIAKLNNEAVRKLNSNDFESSIRDLAGALKADYEVLAALSAPPPSLAPSSSCSNAASLQLPRITLSKFPKHLLSIDNWMVAAASSDDGFSSRPPTTTTTTKDCTAMTNSFSATPSNSDLHHQPYHQEDSLYIYRHPIYIPTEVTAVLFEAGRWPESERTVDKDLISQLLKLAAIAITFNLAIVYQQKAAVATATVRRRTMKPTSLEELKLEICMMLRRSRMLFQQSYNLCRKTYEDWHHSHDIALHDGNDYSNTTTLLSLAALNNVSALFKWLGEPESASAGFQDLLSSLMVCTVFETDRNKTSRYTAFFHNTAKLSYPDCSICAGSA